MNVAKRNHYLPQFNLQHFVNIYDKHFWVYYKGQKAPQPQTPINTCIEKNLYTVKHEDGSTNDLLEKAIFAPIEGAVSQIIARLVSASGRLKETDIPDLAQF